MGDAAWRSGAFVRHEAFGLGLRLFACWSPSAVGPIGMVWGFWSECGGDGNRLDILGSFTEPYARRTGVRTFINDTIFEAFETKVITTWQGSDDGKAFMESYGYKYDKNRLLWSITKAQRKRVKRRAERES